MNFLLKPSVLISLATLFVALVIILGGKQEKDNVVAESTVKPALKASVEESSIKSNSKKTKQDSLIVEKETSAITAKDDNLSQRESKQKPLQAEVKGSENKQNTVVDVERDSIPNKESESLKQNTVSIMPTPPGPFGNTNGVKVEVSSDVVEEAKKINKPNVESTVEIKALEEKIHTDAARSNFKTDVVEQEKQAAPLSPSKNMLLPPPPPAWLLDNNKPKVVSKSAVKDKIETSESPKSIKYKEYWLPPIQPYLYIPIKPDEAIQPSQNGSVIKEQKNDANLDQKKPADTASHLYPMDKLGK